MFKFNQNAWLKPYIDMNTNLRKKCKMMNNAVFGKPMENVTKYRDIKPVIPERRRNYLVYEPNYHTTKIFTKNLLAIEMKKTQILTNKPLYL